MRMDALCDGREFLSADQVAARANITTELVRQAVVRGQLCPGKVGTQLVFTRRDVDRYMAWKAEHAITTQLAAGQHPLDVYLAGDGSWSLDQVTRVMLRWAKLAGVWVVEAPRGSYARWLDRMGLTSWNPRLMRRLVELLLTDEYVRRLCVRKLAVEASAAKGADASSHEGLAGVAGASAPPAPPSE